MNSTLDKFAQFDKGILSEQNQNVNKHAQKLSHALHIFQQLRVFALLIYKKGVQVGVIHAGAVARFKSASEGEGVGNSVKKRPTA